MNSKAIQKITSSTDGSIEGIQGFFNRIFQLANNDGSQDTLAACFGITPATPDPRIKVGYDLPGNDYRQITKPVGTLGHKACHAACKMIQRVPCLHLLQMVQDGRLMYVFEKW